MCLYFLLILCLCCFSIIVILLRVATTDCFSECENLKKQALCFTGITLMQIGVCILYYFESYVIFVFISVIGLVLSIISLRGIE